MARVQARAASRHVMLAPPPAPSAPPDYDEIELAQIPTVDLQKDRTRLTRQNSGQTDRQNNQFRPNVVLTNRAAAVSVTPPPTTPPSNRVGVTTATPPPEDDYKFNNLLGFFKGMDN